MKKNNRGFMLAETLLVTTFVAGVLIYLYIQFNNLDKNYSDSFKYNTVEGLYDLSDIIDFIYEDQNAIGFIRDNIGDAKYIDISNCSLFTDKETCIRLFKLENINEILITPNLVPKSVIKDYSPGLTRFIGKINAASNEPYRVIASFNNNTYATLRFGDING